MRKRPMIEVSEHLVFHSMLWSDAVARILLACLFGFIVGYERNSKNKPIDFRVYMIIASISCMFAIMAQELNYFYQDSGALLQLDLGKVLEGIMVSIGFLGAGAIIHPGRSRVLGTATAASIWASGAVGLMLGFGLYSLAILAFATLIFILIVLGYLRKPLFDEKEVYSCEDDMRD